MLALAAAPDDEPEPAVQRMAVESEWILRVPVRPRTALQRFRWIEGQGYKCVPTSAIRGAIQSGSEHVDFLLPGRQRVRASFAGSCPALDFYGGFYLKTEDRRVCARRDFVHSRMGGSCRIERLRRLVPRTRDPAIP